jgi:hypothetical protein
MSDRQQPDPVTVLLWWALLVVAPALALHTKHCQFTVKRTTACRIGLTNLVLCSTVLCLLWESSKCGSVNTAPECFVCRLAFELAVELTSAVQEQCTFRGAFATLTGRCSC